MVTGVGQAPTEVQVAVVGGGIGGLAVAVALLQDGLDVHVYERTSVLSEVGGAVLIREPSVRLFEQWGLEAFHERAVPVETLEVYDRGGALIRTAGMDFLGDGRVWAVHRADVHDLLRSAVPEDRLHLGRLAGSVRNDEDGRRAWVSFPDHSRVSARLVVGADGIRSVVRKLVSLDEPVFQGHVVTRGVTPASALPDGVPNDRVRMWIDHPRMILTLPMRGGSALALDSILGEDLPPEELWTAEYPTEDLLARFADFDPALRRLISSCSDVRANPVYDREPIRAWAVGRVVLAGDAAHPMAPRQGQGANQAIQDAGALAAALRQHGLDRIEAGLSAYQEARVGPATAMQLASRQIPKQFASRG